MGQMIRGEGDHQQANDIDTEDASQRIQNISEGTKLREEYEGKLATLEKERETIDLEKAQVERYKQLLLKQRDIMIA